MLSSTCLTSQSASFKCSKERLLCGSVTGISQGPACGFDWNLTVYCNPPWMRHVHTQEQSGVSIERHVVGRCEETGKDAEETPWKHET